jgi:hypothetical protein
MRQNNAWLELITGRPSIVSPASMIAMLRRLVQLAKTASTPASRPISAIAASMAALGLRCGHAGHHLGGPDHRRPRGAAITHRAQPRWQQRRRARQSQAPSGPDPRA